jgi:hypothetical protein
MGPEMCEKYQHPLPLIQEILDNLRYFTKIDFMDSYFYILIKAKYRNLFAFATRRGVYIDPSTTRMDEQRKHLPK